ARAGRHGGTAGTDGYDMADGAAVAAGRRVRDLPCVVGRTRVKKWLRGQKHAQPSEGGRQERDG
ncbi:hypothetical protein, partial [Streptomyces sparsus]